MKKLLLSFLLLSAAVTADAQLTVNGPSAGGASGVSHSILLATVNSVPTDSDTATLYTAPAGTKAVVTRAVMRNASTSLVTISASAQLDPNPGADDFNNSLLASLEDADSFIAVGHRPVPSVPRSSFGIIFDNHGLSATVTIDVFGYLVDSITYVPVANIKTP